jgi:hypothetical protein
MVTVTDQVDDVADAARMLRRLLDQVENGTLTAPAGFAERVAGAIVALDAVAGRAGPQTTEGSD